MITEMATQFSTLPPQDCEFIVSWMRENFSPIERVPKTYATAAGFLKQPFSRLYFYVTKEQFAEAMRLAGFKVLIVGDDFYFNIGNRSPAYEIYRTKGGN